MAALLGFIKKPEVKEYIQGYHSNGDAMMYDDIYSVLRKAGSLRMVDAVCCGKVKQPALHFIKTKSCPKMIPMQCTHAIIPHVPCPFCGADKRLEILEVMTHEFGEEEVKVIIWMDARRQGQKEEGTYNTQRELQLDLLTINVLLERFRALLSVCITHCQEIRWVRLMIKLDFAQLKPNTLLIFTDFAAVMAL